MTLLLLLVNEMKMMRLSERNLQIEPVSSVFFKRIFIGLIVLIILSIGVYFVGHYLAGQVSRGGHSENTRLERITIGDNILMIPQNMIRYRNQRHSGKHNRINLYVKWPQMVGYYRHGADAFNNRHGRRDIIFISIERQAMSHDMSKRFEPIYRDLIEPQGKQGPANLTIYKFKPNSGYIDEVMVAGYEKNGDIFAARCLSNEMAKKSLAPCERDINFGKHLSLTYRFPEKLLKDWSAMDRAIKTFAKRLLRRAKPRK